MHANKVMRDLPSPRNANSGLFYFLLFFFFFLRCTHRYLPRALCSVDFDGRQRTPLSGSLCPSLVPRCKFNFSCDPRPVGPPDVDVRFRTRESAGTENCRGQWRWNFRRRTSRKICSTFSQSNRDYRPRKREASLRESIKGKGCHLVLNPTAFELIFLVFFFCFCRQQYLVVLFRFES